MKACCAPSSSNTHCLAWSASPNTARPGGRAATVVRKGKCLGHRAARLGRSARRSRGPPEYNAPDPVREHVGQRSGILHDLGAELLLELLGLFLAGLEHELPGALADGS